MGLYQGDNLLSSIGKSPAAYAKDNGYTGTDDEFYSALADMPGHLDNKENPHGVTAAQVGADASGAAATALANAKSYTDQEVANATPGTATKDSPTGADSLFLYDAADSNKPKKTLISKLVELFKNTFYTKDETSTLLANNDPRNWGLGKLIGKYVADLNTHLENGWYYTDASTVNSPVNTGAIVEVSNRDNTIEVQTFRYWIGSGISIKVERLFNGSAWQPWEWVNPPMDLGVEYRTTERYLGKPVYCILENWGGMPNASRKYVQDALSGRNSKAVLSCEGYPINRTTGVYYYKAPMFEFDKSVSTSAYPYIHYAVRVSSGGGGYIMSYNDMTAFDIYVLSKYTKTTD